MGRLQKLQVFAIFLCVKGLYKIYKIKKKNIYIYIYIYCNLKI
nr:MAG TPA: hypothetical protein [Caudoviricetes sp.]